jgi:arginyl-tRNA synthetase
VPEESVALEGHSGPYLQYSHARARSIIRKASNDKAEPLDDLEPDERTLALKLSEYPLVLEKAVNALMPHFVATYLYEVAQGFNRFYESNRVIGDKREAVRLRILTLYADILRDGLKILGIGSPDSL